MVKEGPIPLAECTALSRDRVGGKAATLALLRAAGLPVPDGVVLPVGSEPSAELAEEVIAALGAGPLAVRSSGGEEDGAAGSHAGQYRTVLGVTGAAELEAAIKECQASAYSPQVRRYRAEHGLPEDAAIAVLVQRQVPADAAGVAFTANPVTGARDEIVVNAVQGLGDRLVDGVAQPEQWVIGGQDPVGDPRGVLSARQVRAVADLARRVAAEFDEPQDLEWAIAQDTVWLLQARPITSLPEPSPPPVPVPVEIPPGFWTRASLHQPLPSTPLNTTVTDARNAAFERLTAELGLLLDFSFTDIGGWSYMSISPAGGRQGPPPPKWLMWLLVRLVPAARRRTKAAERVLGTDLPGRLVTRWREQWLGEFSRRCGELLDTDLSGLSDVDFIAHVDRADRLMHDCSYAHFILHGAVGMALFELVGFCDRELGWPEARVYDLLGGLSERSTEPARELATIASLVRGRSEPLRELVQHDPVISARVEEYQRRFGRRALRYEIAEPTLAEEPELLLRLLADQVASEFDAARLSEVHDQRAVAEEQALAGLPAAERSEFLRLLARARAAYPVREDNEFWTVSCPIAVLRYAALEAGRRLAGRGQISARDEVFHLYPAEVREALLDGADRSALVRRRQGERAWMLAHPGPDSYGKDPGPPPSMSALPPAARHVNEMLLWLSERAAQGSPRGGDGLPLSGVAGSPGTCTGRVRVIMDESELGRIEPGDVLVCPVTAPVWSVVFPSIGALVTDVGGMLAHGAIIAREYRVPAVLGTGVGTSVLEDGDLVTVDGTTGTVTAAR
ncbi:PEP/pyruvate-binding domain-containing protein [Allokutzneria albata]|uniref:Pyruvate, water dikinase n=1 Tax=Allokutzneria albata TaxID=211114 RepID=A0A1G9TI09_ALLAB|nr:PEP/pyruvate-binding domain-containing protein [Allokutzneria albata]SDM47283.1 pyruvate, water dikinase [Allokutzneria albata]